MGTYRGGHAADRWYGLEPISTSRHRRRLSAWREMAEEEDLDWQAYAERDGNEGLEASFDGLSDQVSDVILGAASESMLGSRLHLDEVEDEQMQLAMALSLSEATLADEQASRGDDASSEAAFVDASDASDA